MSRIAAFFVFVIASIIFLFVGEGSGLSIIGENYGGELHAHSSPISIFEACAYLAFMVFHGQARYVVSDDSSISIFRRIGAVFVDVVSLVIVVTPLLVFSILMTNLLVNGYWEWRVSINLSKNAASAASILLITVYFVSIVYNIFKSVTKGRSTVGQFISGYRFLPDYGGSVLLRAFSVPFLWIMFLVMWPFYLVRKVAFGGVFSVGSAGFLIKRIVKL